LQLPLITVQWFMCVFVNTLKPAVALRVWDIFLNEGSKVLFRISAALFQLNEAKLLAAKDASDLFNLLRNIGKDVMDADALIALAYKGFTTKPLLYRISVTPTVSPKESNNKKAGQDAARALRSVSVGSASDVANPRLRASNKLQGAVPADLIGIGLAHIGPDKCPQSPVPRTEAYTENLAYLDLVGTIGEPSSNSNRNSFNSTAGVNGGSATTTPVKSGGVAFAAGNTLLSRAASAAATFRSPARERRESADGDRNSFSGASGRPRSIRQFTPLEVSSEQLNYETYIQQNPQKAPGVRKRRANKVLDFYRADIALWRSSYRPSLEEQYKAMEEARQEWKREASIGRYAELAQRKSESAPVTPVKGGSSAEAAAPSKSSAVPAMAAERSTDTIGTALPDSEEDEAR
jgi:hypothetical protein